MSVRIRAPSTAPPSPAVTRPSLPEVNGFRVADEDFRELFAQAKARGIVVSMAGLVTAAAPFDDGDRFLSRAELLAGLNTLNPTALPPQTGDEAAPAVRRALARALSTFRAGGHLSARGAAVLPPGLARVIVEQVGAGPEVSYLSAYIDGGCLRRLRMETEVWFEHRAFGHTEAWGPFRVTHDGLDALDLPPEYTADAHAEAGLVAGMPSQVELRRAHAAGTLLRAETFDFDATTSDCVKNYRDLAVRQRARLTAAQVRAMEGLTAYKSHGPQTPAVNDWLRSAHRGRHVDVSLLDDAVRRAVSLPTGTLLFRGFAATSVQGLRADLLNDPAYLCTSLDPGIARMFADNAARDGGGKKFLVVMEAGRAAVGLVTGNHGETEVVLPRSTPLHIVEKRRERGFTLLHVRFG